MADVFSTNVLTGVVNSLQTPPQFLLDNFFRTVQTEQSEEVHFDVMNDVMKLAPFVMPTVEGQVVTEQGYTTKTFKPAYIKPKTPWDPNKAIKRTAGEAIGGSLSPEQRRNIQINNILGEHKVMLERRLEVMASEVIRTGQVTIVGDKYPQVVVSFGRDAALTFTLDGSAEWGDSGVNPLDTLQDAALLVQEKSGATANQVVMDVKAWKLFRSDSYVKERLDKQRALSSVPALSQNAILGSGAQYMGTVDLFEIYVYSGYYKTDAGVLTKIIPDYTVLLAGDMMGVRAYGAILDESAGMQALPLFSKSWVTEDPSRRWIMTQSAPILVPYRVNAMACITVKS